MGALRPGCPVGGHRALIWPQESNIDRKINKCWLRVVFRNVRFDLRFSLSSTVDMDKPRELEWSDTHCVIPGYSFSWSHIMFTFQPCVWIYDWIETHFYRMFWKIGYQIGYHSIHGYITQLHITFSHQKYTNRDWSAENPLKIGEQII